MQRHSKTTNQNHYQSSTDKNFEFRRQRIQRLAKLMDSAFKIPGTDRTVGWDSLVGLIPGIGDAATVAVSAWIVREAYLLGLPKWKLAQMAANIGIDFLVGSIPLLGDLFDFAFKANVRNADLVERHLQREQMGPSANVYENTDRRSKVVEGRVVRRNYSPT